MPEDKKESLLVLIADTVLGMLSAFCLTLSLFIFFDAYKIVGTEPAWYFLALSAYLTYIERSRKE